MRKSVVVGTVVFTAVLFAASLGTSFFQADGVDADETLTRANVGGDGDASFTLEVRTFLRDDTEREAFRRYQNEVENDTDPSLSSFRDSISVLVEDASRTTGRDMSATNFTVETTVEPAPVRRGIVRYTFEWSGFAEVDGDTVRAGDVLSGYILRDTDALVIEAPEGYAVDGAEPSADSARGGEVRWAGERDFDEDEPRVSFAPDGGGGDGATDGGTGDPGDGNDTDGVLSAYAAALVALLLLAVGAAAYRYLSDDEDEHNAGGADARSAEDTDPGGSLSQGDDGDTEPKPTFEELPDAERVLSIIGSEGGRMKQKKVVQRTGWSEAKVSQVTSRLEDDDDITKLRMGRENIIELNRQDGGGDPS